MVEKSSEVTKKIALLGILGGLALVLSFLENQLMPDIPFLPVGAKLGLSNIVTMITADLMGFSGAVYITLIKVLFAFITRGATASFMSLSGGLLSTAIVCILIKKKDKWFSFAGIGIAGAVAHNIGQLLASCVISGTWSLLNYGKYLLIFALVSGALTGTMLLVIMPRIEKISYLDFTLRA